MIPAFGENILITEVLPQPSKTYRLCENGRISGKIDDIEAVRQAVIKILNTERYKEVVYSWNYGVEFQKLYGKDREYVLSEVKRTVTEALEQDDRIIGVDDFRFSTTPNGLVVTFTVKTIYGDTEVNADV